MPATQGIDTTSPTSQEIEALIDAISASNTSQPLSKIIADEHYENWWKSTLRQQEILKDNKGQLPIGPLSEKEDKKKKQKDIILEDYVNKQWKTHKALIQREDAQSKKNLFSFATTISKVSKNDALTFKSHALPVVLAINSLISITLSTILLNNKMANNTGKSQFSSDITTSSKGLSWLADIFINIQKGEYASASLNITNVANSIAKIAVAITDKALFSIAVAGETLVKVSPTTLPFIGLGLLVAGASLNEYKMHQTKDKIEKLASEIAILESETSESTSIKTIEEKASEQKSLHHKKSELIDLKSTLHGQENSRSSAFYIALSVTSIVLAATAASVVTAGAFPAALVVGFGVAYLGATIAQKFQSHKLAQQTKQNKLGLKHEEILTKISPLNTNYSLLFDTPLLNDVKEITVNDYIKILIKKSPNNAESLLDSLENFINSAQNLKQTASQDKTSDHLAQIRYDTEKTNLMNILSELSPPPSKHLSASELFSAALLEKDTPMSAPLQTEKEEKIQKIENAVKNVEDFLQIKIFQHSDANNTEALPFNSVIDLAKSDSIQSQELKKI